MSVNPDEFREALRCWASGVTVVTARCGKTIHGMTASSFSSVSAEPPLVLICANKQSRTHRVIEEGGLFTVNILNADQQDVSNLFASSKTEGTRFDTASWTASNDGAPLIDGAVASLECEVATKHREGSHTIYVGRVKRVHVNRASPLIYFNGRYHALP